MVSVIQYSTEDGKQKIDKILSRSQLETPNIQSSVDEILKQVKLRGDSAVFDYTEKFDGFKLTKDTIKVSEKEIEEAYAAVGDEFVEVVRKAIERIRRFHEKQKINSWIEPDLNGEILGQLVRPLDSVGVYVPGGKASYPSSVLMNVVPAKVANVGKIVMVTPVRKNGMVSQTSIVAAVEAGVAEIYKIGGAQAVAALAYGTQTIPKVDKIVGPGNIYVALAKRSVYGYVSIDSIAGPSEILVIADETANAKYVAADMLSQAEHDEMASAILVTNCKKLAHDVKFEIKKQSDRLERSEIIEKSLTDYGAIIITDNLEQAAELSNSIAPEHLELCINDPFTFITKIKHAGAIFMGNYSPEPLGDYMAGPNHVLPTGSTAKFFSPLSVDDFIKKSSVISFSKEALVRLGKDVITFAEAEHLTAHANSIKVRLGLDEESY